MTSVDLNCPNNIDIADCKARVLQAVRGTDKHNARLSFYLNQGMTEDDDKIALSERQSTFSLQKCIERYGEVEGLRVFNTRQEKWQETLNSKSEDEIIEIGTLQKALNFLKSENDIEKEFNENFKPS